METVNHPPHYQTPAGIEAIDVMERYGLGPHLFVAMKHLLRAGKKGDLVTDLRKAEWYMRRAEAGSAFLYEHCWADHWQHPDAIKDAFDLQGDHGRAVTSILIAAVKSDPEARRQLIQDALHAVHLAIEEAGRRP